MLFCPRCKEYKGIVTCELCETEFCGFCQGDATGKCPDCADDTEEGEQ